MVAARQPFDALENRMRIWRASMAPPVPDTYQNLFDILHAYPWRPLRTHDHVSIQMNCPVINNDSAIVYGDPNFINNIPDANETVDSIHIFTSSLVRPYQLAETQSVLYVTAVDNKRVCMPFFSLSLLLPMVK